MIEDKIERLDSQYLDSLPYGLMENILVGKGLGEKRHDMPKQMKLM